MNEQQLQEKFLVPLLTNQFGYNEISPNTVNSSLIIEEDLEKFLSQTSMNQKQYDLLLRKYGGDRKELLKEVIQLIQERIGSSRNMALFLNTNKSITIKGVKLFLFYTSDSLIYKNDLFEENIFSVVQELPYKYKYNDNVIYSFRPDLSFFLNGIFIGYSELKSNYNNQTASKNGRGKVIQDYYEAVRIYYEYFDRNGNLSEKEKELYRRDFLKVFEKAIHITTTDIEETYVIRTIADYFDELLQLFRDNNFSRDEYEAKVKKIFKPYPLLKQHEDKREKIREIFHYHYGKLFIEKEILYYNFIERDISFIKGRKELKDEKGYLICPRPKQKFGTDKILSKIDEFLEHEKEDDYFEKLLEKQLVGVSELKRKELLKKRQAYSNNKNIYSLLLQYAAGFGKSNIIGWTALQLKDLLRNGEHVYDKILIVVDRLQLRSQIDSKMLNMNIDRKMFSEAYNKKTFQEALQSDTRLIIVNLQKFGNVQEILDKETVSKLNQMRVVFLIDEIHRSNSGDTHEAMISIFDELQKPFDDYSETKRDKKNLIIGFTATPDDNTLARFGEYSRYAENEKIWVPFDSYTMQEAIEDGFILNPIKNIVPIASKMIFDIPDDKLKGFKKKEYKDAQKKQIYEDPDRIKAISKYIVDLLVKDVYRQIRGTGKAMLATYSIPSAIMYFQEIKKQFEEIVKQSKYERFKDAPIYIVYSDSQITESAALLNDGIPEEKVIGNFLRDKNGLIIVVDKLQTGFDEKRLHTLFLDKEVKGINAIQTISRVNRTAKHKNDCKIIDFSYENVNVQNIKEAFQHFSNVVISDFDPFSEKNILELLYNYLKEFAVFTSFFPLFEKQSGSDINEHLDLENKIENYITQNVDLSYDIKAKASQYFTILNKIEYVIQIKSIYSDETFLNFWKFFNKLFNKEFKKTVERDPIEVYFDNKIGIIELITDTKNKKGKKVLKVAEGQPPDGQYLFDVMKIIQEKNEKQAEVEKLIKDFEVKIQNFFQYIGNQEDGKRLIAKIQSAVSEEEIYSDFEKVYRKYKILHRSTVGDYFFNEMDDLVNKLCDDFENFELKKYSDVNLNLEEIKNYTNAYLKKFLGQDQKWIQINQKIWDIIAAKDSKYLDLSDFSMIRKNSEFVEADILTTIGYLSANQTKFLKIKYSLKNQEIEITQQELNRKIKAWKKEKSISTEDWETWASEVYVKWEPDFKKVRTNAK